MLPVRWIVFLEGIRAGAVVGVIAVVLAILGLTPSLAWVPEVPLLGAAVLLPLSVFAVTGYRAVERSGRTIAGALAASVAGAIGGGLGGVMYVIFGKPVLNVAAGLLVGAVSGASVGGVAAMIYRARSGRAAPVQR